MEEKKTRRPSDVVKAEKIEIIEKSIKYHQDCIISLQVKLENIKNNKSKQEQKNDLLTTLIADGKITDDQARLLGFK